jgi:hypothetical protein
MASKAADVQKKRKATPSSVGQAEGAIVTDSKKLQAYKYLWYAILVAIVTGPPVAQASKPAANAQQKQKKVARRSVLEQLRLVLVRANPGAAAGRGRENVGAAHPGGAQQAGARARRALEAMKAEREMAKHKAQGGYPFNMMPYK